MVERNEVMNVEVQVESTVHTNNKRKPAEIQPGKSARTIQPTKVQGTSRKFGGGGNKELG